MYKKDGVWMESEVEMKREFNLMSEAWLDYQRIVNFMSEENTVSSKVLMMRQCEILAEHTLKFKCNHPPCDSDGKNGCMPKKYYIRRYFSCWNGLYIDANGLIKFLEWVGIALIQMNEMNPGVDMVTDNEKKKFLIDSKRYENYGSACYYRLNNYLDVGLNPRPVDLLQNELFCFSKAIDAFYELREYVERRDANLINTLALKLTLKESFVDYQELNDQIQKGWPGSMPVEYYEEHVFAWNSDIAQIDSAAIEDFFNRIDEGYFKDENYATQRNLFLKFLDECEDVHRIFNRFKGHIQSEIKRSENRISADVDCMMSKKRVRGMGGERKKERERKKKRIVEAPGYTQDQYYEWIRCLFLKQNHLINDLCELLGVSAQYDEMNVEVFEEIEVGYDMGRYNYRYRHLEMNSFLVYRKKINLDISDYKYVDETMGHELDELQEAVDYLLFDNGMLEKEIKNQ